MAASWRQLRNSSWSSGDAATGGSSSDGSRRSTGSGSGGSSASTSKDPENSSPSPLFLAFSPLASLWLQNVESFCSPP
ncbi:hypothetical protein NL676_023850 [Syzygium grande]|nr:hypothetical protein NL676_023850 [Syzygium grande]